ncbi:MULTISPECIES: glycosyl transferase [Nocardia]|uniref:glycosyl transferase n=1 Tax=Nocardia TaxID=1817 RepID=UPI001E42A74B|nr:MULTISPECIES: glycosyl transferase [Nocardia]
MRASNVDRAARRESTEGATVPAGAVDTDTLLRDRPEPARTRVGERVTRADLCAGAAYLGLAVLVLSGQWRDTGGAYLIKSGQDQTMWEWFFAVTAHSVAHLENPLGTTLQNFPAGVNLMANTAMFGVGVPLTPVTLLFGPTVTFVLVLTLGLALTAFAWYRLFARELVESRFAAALGGLFCGFAPAMISHANAHPNFVALGLLPVIAGLVIRMSRHSADGVRSSKSGGTVGPGSPGPESRAVRGRDAGAVTTGSRTASHPAGSDSAGSPGAAARVGKRARGVRLRDTLLLALLVTTQIALGEEPLLIFAMSFALFAVVYYLHAPRAGLRALRTVAPTVAVAGLITLALTAIPLWWQFFGSQSYRSIDHGPMGNDLKAITQFPSESLGGLFAPGQPVAINETEQNAYFGWPLLILLAVAILWLWRDRVVRAATAVILVFGVLSLGATAMIGKRSTGVALPWRWAEQVPLVNSVLETRLTMAAIPAIAAILALAAQQAVSMWRESAVDWRPLAWFTATALALLPLTPTPLPVVDRAGTPEFFAHGTVRDYVGDGSVVLVPTPRPDDAEPLRWQTEDDFSFPLAGGYFVGPTGGDKKGIYGPEFRPTTALLVGTRETGVVPRIGPDERANAIADLNFWRADVMVLPPTRNADALRSAVTELLGFAPARIEDVWLWDVRALR